MAGRLVLRFEVFLDWLSDGFVTALKLGAQQPLENQGATLLSPSCCCSGRSGLLKSKGFIGNAFFDTGRTGRVFAPN
jgi:hypothetical protein